MPKFTFKRRKANPPLYLAAGSYLKFEQVTNDVAIYGTDDAGVAGQLEAMMAARRGGVERITPEQFEAFTAQKKSSPHSPKVWREELSNQEIHRKPALVQHFHPSQNPHPTNQPAQAAAAAVAAEGKVRPSRATPLPEGGFRPKVAKPAEPES